MFSPWYAWSGRKNPHNNVCINVATYGPGGRFAMTDRGVSALKQSETSFTVGPSSLRWDAAGHLHIAVDEVSSLPLISRLRGEIVVKPHMLSNVEMPLSPDGAHVWRPFAPSGEIEVNLDRPGWRWSGHGYFDANFGTRALERDFTYWTWARYPSPEGAICLYDAERRDGSTLAAGVRFHRDGTVEVIDTLPPKARLRRSLWGVRRETRADQGYQPRQVKAMLDAPFYNRCAVKTQLDGVETIGVHESLDLRRFDRGLVKAMLAVRVPRRRNWSF